MSMRIQQVNGRCPCQRCQCAGENPVLDAVALDYRDQPKSQRPLFVQVRLLLARAKRSA